MAAAQKKRKRHETALASAVAHPIRSRCLAVLAERVASPAEIARELNMEVSKVGYHVTALKDANLIEEVGNRPVRGAVEHFYRAVTQPVVSDEKWNEMSIADKRVYTESTLSIFAANAAHSISVGTFFDRPDHHMTRYAFAADRQGWTDITAAYLELYERVYEIREEITERMAVSEEDPIPVVSFLGFFEVPPTPK